MSAKGTVLVIEDDPDIRELLQMTLEMQGWDTDAAGNGREGVERARRQRPHAILCDIMMPELDGFGVLDQLQADPALRDVPLIFVTALTEAAVNEKAAGRPFSLVRKPFTEEGIRAAISQRLGGA